MVRGSASLGAPPVPVLRVAPDRGLSAPGRGCWRASSAPPHDIWRWQGTRLYSSDQCNSPASQGARADRFRSFGYRNYKINLECAKFSNTMW